YRSQVYRFRYHPSTDFGSVDSQSDRDTATGAMPAGAAMHFWDAENPASIPSFANGSGSPPREETASTITNASAAWAAATIASRAAWPGPAIGNTCASGADQMYRNISRVSEWAFTQASP